MPQRDPRSLHVSPAVPEPTPDAAPTAPRRRRWPWVLVAFALLVGVPAMGFALAAWGSWRDVERVTLTDVLAGSPTGTNYLIVGTDSREGVDPGTASAGVIFGEGVSGERTDTIAVLRVDGGAVSLLAIPRDLYVPLGGGAPERINAANVFGGPALLVDTVQRELDIGLDHYLQLDLAGFIGLVDALGGITIDFPYPAFDERSGLGIAEAGPQRLDGDTALAYVRSRRYTEFIDGAAVTDPTSDLGRVQRQQRFLAAVMDELGATRNPFTLLSALDAVAGHVAVDDGMGLRDAMRLGLDLRGAAPTTATVPASRYFTDAGADVLVLNGESEAVLAAFRG